MHHTMSSHNDWFIKSVLLEQPSASGGRIVPGHADDETQAKIVNPGQPAMTAQAGMVDTFCRYNTFLIHKTAAVT